MKILRTNAIWIHDLNESKALIVKEAMSFRYKECRSQEARSLFGHRDQHLPRREDIVFRHWPSIKLLPSSKPTKAALLAEIARCEKDMGTLRQKKLA